MTLNEALAGKEIPDEIKKDLMLIDVPFISFDGEVRAGQLVVHRDLAEEAIVVFKKLTDLHFPIEQVIPVVAFGWDDDTSMRANNTSGFNYRIIYGTDRLSNHSYGRALDINPMQNPYVRRDGSVVPEGARYATTQSGTITTEIAALFKSFGWSWGGDWTDRKDWQHFEKPKKN